MQLKTILELSDKIQSLANAGLAQHDVEVHVKNKSAQGDIILKNPNFNFVTTGNTVKLVIENENRRF